MRSKLLVLFSTLGLAACAGTMPNNLGVKSGQLAACPASPNCVSSQAPASDGQHHIAALRLRAADVSWQQVVAVVSRLPRTTLVRQEEGYLHAESRSALLGFVDDVELYRAPGASLLELRSASRLGLSDFGVNRARAQSLGSALGQAGLLAE
ncbi:DUF1499 domain-containing protein [Craterilacuibacter sp.]|uniref:DUF1499 domain-containing protein n=1 Tax=Craterilacuibacter sp. TaxID=2870909 RepID=UPI003F33265F